MIDTTYVSLYKKCCLDNEPENQNFSYKLTVNYCFLVTGNMQRSCLYYILITIFIIIHCHQSEYIAVHRFCCHTSEACRQVYI